MARAQNIEWSDVDESNPRQRRRNRNVRVLRYSEQGENEQALSNEGNWLEEGLRRYFEDFEESNFECLQDPDVRATPLRLQNPPSYGLVRAVRSRQKPTQAAWIAFQQYPGTSFTHAVAREIIRHCTRRPDSQRFGGLQEDETTGTEASVSAGQNRATDSGNSAQSESSSSSDQSLDIQRSGELQDEQTSETEASVPADRNPVTNFGNNTQAEASSSSIRSQDIQRSGELQDDETPGMHTEAPVGTGQYSTTNFGDRTQSPTSSPYHGVTRKRRQTADAEEADKITKQMEVTPRKVSKVGPLQSTVVGDSEPLTETTDTLLGTHSPQESCEVKLKPPSKTSNRPKNLFPHKASISWASHKLPARQGKPSNVGNHKLYCKIGAKSKRPPRQKTANLSRTSELTAIHLAGQPSTSGIRKPSKISRQLKQKPTKYAKRPIGKFLNLFCSQTRSTASEDSSASQHRSEANLGAGSLSLRRSMNDLREETSNDHLVPERSRHSSGRRRDTELSSIDDYLETSTDNHEPATPTRKSGRLGDTEYSSMNDRREETSTDHLVLGASTHYSERPGDAGHSSMNDQRAETPTDRLVAGALTHNSGRPGDVEHNSMNDQREEESDDHPVPATWRHNSDTSRNAKHSSMNVQREETPTDHLVPGTSRQNSGRPGDAEELTTEKTVYLCVIPPLWLQWLGSPVFLAVAPPTRHCGPSDTRTSPRAASLVRREDAVPDSGVESEDNPESSMYQQREESSNTHLDPAPSRQESDRPRGADGMRQSDAEPSRQESDRPRGADGMRQSDAGPSRQESDRPRGADGMRQSDAGPSRQESDRPSGIGNLRGSDIEMFLCPESSLWVAETTGLVDTIFWVPIDKAKLLAFFQRQALFENDTSYGPEPRLKSFHTGVRRKVLTKRKNRSRSFWALAQISRSSSLDSDGPARSRRQPRTHPRKKRPRPEPKNSSQTPSTSPDHR